MGPPRVDQLPIKDAYILTHDRFADRRGYFNEFYNEVSYPASIRGSIGGDWKQAAASMTATVDTIRGLHMSPYNKFCSVLTGAIYDVIVDVREDSPTFLKWCGTILSEENRRQIHIPANCYHGFVTIQPDTRMLYLQGGTFDSKNEKDCNPFDKLIDIQWPLANPSNLLISDKDKNAPNLSDESRRPHLKGRSAQKRVLVIGASGQVGSALVQEMKNSGYMVYGTHSANPFQNEYTMKFDLEAAAKEPSLAEELLKSMRPHVVAICAAFTWVDGAEDQEEKAFAINVAGPAAVAAAAKDIGAKLIVYSTEYVWDGTAGPYTEDVPSCAINVYGKSKIAMEDKIREICPSSLILRTTVVYGPEKQGKNFVYQLCKKLCTGSTMNVVSDQISTPTYNRDLALLTRQLVEADASGVFNACGLELLGRYDFALAVAGALGLNKKFIQPTLTADQNQKARRPLKAGMSMDKAKKLLGDKFRMRSVAEAIADWQASPSEGDAPLVVATSNM